jgi:hypothetical protein
MLVLFVQRRATAGIFHLLILYIALRFSRDGDAEVPLLFG